MTAWVTALTISAVTQKGKHRNGKMHSTSTRTQLFGRSGGLPCMQFTLWRLPQQLRQRLQLVLLVGRREQLQRRW